MSTVSGLSNKAIGKLLPIKKDPKSSVQDLTKDDFIINDRVYIASNHDRLGTVVFNGKTKFSDGIWIGVALDKPFGKNNGIVQGVQYFECEENHGIFVRSNNLRHYSEKNLNVTQDSGENILSDFDQLNNSNLPKEVEEFSFVEPFPVSITSSHLNLGDRVYVAGKSGGMHKHGILRFFGYTKFSDGVWAGIELDNPVGKNDGSVNGVRYFSCKPQYGLFSLEHKVKKMDQSTTKGFSRMDSGSKYGSNESVTSIASNFSSASRTRVRLGMNAVSTINKFKTDRTGDNNADKNKFPRLNAKDIKDSDKTSTAMQNVLKEKEQHVEQLMREREIERIDLATATAKIEELERHQLRNLTSYNDQKLIYDMKLNELQSNIFLVCQERDELLERLDESKKKVDDLVFRMEEKYINESDLEHKTEENESQIFELNEKLALERELREQLEKKLKDAYLKCESPVNENIYTIQINCLEEKLKVLESELNDERNNSKIDSLSKLLEEKEIILLDLHERLENVKSLNLEEKLIKLESELSKEQNISKEFSKVLEGKEIFIANLQERLDEIQALNLENKLTVLNTEIIAERNKSDITSQLLKEKDEVIHDLQERIKDNNCLNLEGIVTKLESDIIESKNNCQTLSGLLEEKENALQDLQELLKEVQSLHSEDKLTNSKLQMIEEENSFKILTLSKLLEEKQTTINDLTSCLEEIKSRNLEQKLKDLENNLIEERNNSMVPSLYKSLEDKDLLINDLQSRIEQVTTQSTETKHEMESVTILNKSQETEIINLHVKIDDINGQLLNLKDEISQKQLKYTNENCTQTEEEYCREILDLKSKLENLKIEKDKDNYLLATIKEECLLYTQEADEKQKIYNDLYEKYLKLEVECTDKTKLFEEDNNKLGLQLSSCNEQLKDLRIQISESSDLNSKLLESKYEIENNEKKLKINIELLENQNTLLEDENQELKQYLKKSENDDTRNNYILQLSGKIEDLESSIMELNLSLSVQEEKYARLLSENEILQTKLEALEQTEGNANNLKAQIKLLEDKIAVLETENIGLNKILTEVQNDTTKQKYIVELSEKIENLEFSIIELNVSFKSEKEQNTSLLTENECLKSKLEQLSQFESNENILRTNIRHLEDQISLLINENCDLKKRLQESLNDESRSNCILELSSKIEDLESLIMKSNAALKSEKEVNAGFIAENATLHTKLDDIENNLSTKLKLLGNQITELEKENECLRQNLVDLENDTTKNSSILQMSLKIDELESLNVQSNSALNSEKQQNSVLNAKIYELQCQVELLEHTRDEDDNDLCNQLESLKSINQLLELDKLSLSEIMESKNSELIVIRDRLLKISQEYERLQEDSNESNHKFESEKRLLSDKVRKLEKQIDEQEKKSQFSASDSSDKRKIDNKEHIALLKAAKENSEQQISFLNTVIIDREKKFHSIQQENQILKEKIKDLENGNIVPPMKTKKIIPPRLYCDTCEIFDSHDTENCTVIDDRSNPPSPQLVLRQVKINAKAPRLYCDICEIFDAHDTRDCQDQQTF